MNLKKVINSAVKKAATTSSSTSSSSTRSSSSSSSSSSSTSGSSAWAKLKKQIKKSPAVTQSSESSNGNSSAAPSVERNATSTVEAATDFAIGDINFDSAPEPEIQSYSSQSSNVSTTTDNDSSETASPDLPDHLHISDEERAFIYGDNETTATEDASEAAETEQTEEAGATEEAGEAEEAVEEGEEEAFVLGADDPDNPYSEHNATAVEVQAWDGTGGNPNDHIEGILINQGYTVEEIYTANENGQTLVDQVAEVNELDDPNVISEGQNLVVPTTAEASPPLEDVIVNEAPPFADGAEQETEGTDNGETSITTGTDGDDRISVATHDGDDTIEVNAGAGNDEIAVSAGDGTDTVTVDAGAGDDIIALDTPTEGSWEYSVAESKPVRTTDSITVDGGEGEDTAIINTESGVSSRFNEETGETRFYASNGTAIDFNNVENVQVVDADGNVTEYSAGENGELVEVQNEAEVEEASEVEESAEVAETEEEAPAELSQGDALEVLDDNWRWVADSENGDADNGSTARVDEGLADIAADDWSGRDAYVENLTQSVNPNAEVEGSFYTQEEADAAADELQAAARTVNESDALVGIIDGGDDNDTDARDQKFDREDLQNGIRALSNETQGHLDVVSSHSDALQTLQDEAYTDSANGELRQDLFQDLAGLQSDEDYAAWTRGEIDFDEFLDRNEEGAEMVDILLDSIDVPEGSSELAVLNELIGASVFLADGDNFQQVSAADGTHGSIANNRRTVDDSLSIEGDINATAELV